MQSDSKKISSPQVTTPDVDVHIVFFPLLTLSLILWFVYRSIFTFPVWFDEILGKALFFGIPVWLYIIVTQSKSIADSFAPNKLYVGLLQGIAIGGIFGFATSIITLMMRGTGVQSALLFQSQDFWYEFLLAFFTAFWETLFFFSFVMSVVQEKFQKWGLTNQVVFVASVFLLFHIPNIFLRFDLSAAIMQVGLLFLFALGQALLFSSKKNAYILIISHAIWGMVLLTHTGTI